MALMAMSYKGVGQRLAAAENDDVGCGLLGSWEQVVLDRLKVRQAGALWQQPEPPRHFVVPPQNLKQGKAHAAREARACAGEAF
jgi:hypothetical protein